MGLDQRAYALQPQTKEQQLELLIEYGEIEPPEFLIATWRKNYGLEHWMRRLFKEKIGSPYEGIVYLTEEDLDQLAHDIQWDAMNPKQKFGNNMPNFDSAADIELWARTTNRFIQRARKALKKGMLVYYTSG